ncbi:hypothetical protein [Spirillospora sp. NPDC047279]|uniref:hypothetical protein n=1 Tax=Spirillospora sp. NPDC047279 TaxID=3155478 RepID=UPI0033EF1260
MPAAILALALSVSACGGDDKDGAAGGKAGGASGSPSASPSAPAVITPGNQAPGSGTGAGNGTGSGQGTGNLTPAQKKSLQTLTKVAKCMRAKGYQVDDPKPGDFGVAPKNVTDANKANADSAACVKQANSGG